MSLTRVRSISVALTCALASVGCGESGTSSSSGPEAASGGSIAGSAKTADGRPLDTFTVSFEGWPTGALGSMDGNGHIASPASGKVDATGGRYEINVPPGQYTTNAQTTVTWHDKPYSFQLEPADGKDDASRADVSNDHGLTRDYVWKMTGTRPGKNASYVGSGWERNLYGATISMDVYQSDTDNYKHTQPDLRETNGKDAIEFTLVPKGKLIDGSDGKTIIEKVDVAKAGQYGCGIRGIPVGDYTLTAKIVKAEGGGEPVRVSLTPAAYVTPHDDTKTRVPWAASVDVVFEPEEGLMANYGTKPLTIYVGK